MSCLGRKNRCLVFMFLNNSLWPLLSIDPSAWGPFGMSIQRCCQSPGLGTSLQFSSKVSQSHIIMFVGFGSSFHFYHLDEVSKGQFVQQSQGD